MYKENAVRSKIPIPVDPLPPLSEAIFQRQCNKNDRHPLETIYQESVNLESVPVNKKVLKVDKVKKCNKKLDLRKIDSRHVTIRSKTKKLDWDYNVFNDGELERKKNVLEVSKNNYGESSKTSNPVKSIKRSLKRPHSRELQGVYPISTWETREQKQKRKLDFSEHNLPSIRVYLPKDKKMQQSPRF